MLDDQIAKEQEKIEALKEERSNAKDLNSDVNREITLKEENTGQQHIDYSRHQNKCQELDSEVAK